MNIFGEQILIYKKEMFFTPFLSVPEINPADNTGRFVVRFYSQHSFWERLALVTRRMIEDYERIPKSFHDHTEHYKVEVLSPISRDTFAYLESALNPDPSEIGFYTLDTNELLFLMVTLRKTWEKEYKINKLQEGQRPFNPITLNEHVMVKPKFEDTPSSGFVYLIKMVNGDYWKIGRAKDPNDRIKIFNVMLPFHVEFEHVIETANMHDLERQLHIRYMSKRVRGEWFNLTEADVQYIKGL